MLEEPKRLSDREKKQLTEQYQDKCLVLSRIQGRWNEMKMAPDCDKVYLLITEFNRIESELFELYCKVKYG